METKLNFTYNPDGESTPEMIGISSERASKLIDSYNKIIKNREVGFLEPLKQMCDNGQIKTLEELLLLAQYAGFKQGSQAMLGNSDLLATLLQGI